MTAIEKALNFWELWEIITGTKGMWAQVSVIGLLVLAGVGLTWITRGLVSLLRPVTDTRSGRASLTPLGNSETSNTIQWLLDLHETGTHFILNRPIAYQHFSRLEQDFDTWSRIASNALKQAGANASEISRFTTLQDVQTILSANAVSPQHQSLLNNVNKRLTVLRGIAERIQYDGAKARK